MDRAVTSNPGLSKVLAGSNLSYATHLVVRPGKSGYDSSMTEAQELSGSDERGTYGHEISLERGIEARKLRERNELTRPRLADLINKSERSIFRWETQGISEENFLLIEQAINVFNEARADGAKGTSRLAAEVLRQASTLDLALELVSRAREIEARNRAFDELKASLKHQGLSHLIPEDF